MVVTRQGWRPPAEIQSVPFVVKLMTDFFSSMGIKPIKELNSQDWISSEAQSTIDYRGSEFTAPDEMKLVEFRSSGWQYNGHVISRPLAVEVADGKKEI